MSDHRCVCVCVCFSVCVYIPGFLFLFQAEDYDVKTHNPLPSDRVQVESIQIHFPKLDDTHTHY